MYLVPSDRRAFEMSTRTRRLKLLASGLVVAMATVSAGESQSTGTAQASYTAATLNIFGARDQAWLALFPTTGQEMKVPLRPGLNGGFYFLGSNSDATVLYGGIPGQDYAGLKELQLKPVRERVVPSSVGLGNLLNLTVSREPGKFFVSAWSMRSGTLERGDFEIDSNAGVFRPLRLSKPPDWGGPISPDGKTEIHTSGHNVSLIDLATGTSVAIGTDIKWPEWSPDGRWIAAVVRDAGVIIDPRNPSEKRHLGNADGPMIWSPDSKYLLLQKSQISCWPTLYGVSLEVLNVETRKRSVIKSSHCNVLGGTSMLWINRGAVQ
jgi:hypothetical protein